MLVAEGRLRSKGAKFGRGMNAEHLVGIGFEGIHFEGRVDRQVEVHCGIRVAILRGSEWH